MDDKQHEEPELKELFAKDMMDLRESAKAPTGDPTVPHDTTAMDLRTNLSMPERDLADAIKNGPRR